MPHIVGVCNLKGGCGKSTIAVNLASELSTRNKTAVLVDADAQGTASFWASQGKLSVAVEPLPLEATKDAARWINRVLGMKEDYVVLDAPPHVGSATEAIVGVADLVLVPVTPSSADLAATESAVKLIAKARQARSDKGPKCLLVPSKVDRRTAIGRELEGALKQFGEPIGPTIHQRTSVVDALGLGQSIGQFAQNSPAHADFVSLAKLVRAILTKG